jgi:hypothetical protein
VQIKKYGNARVWFLLLSIVYLLQSVIYTTNKASLAKYHISQAEAKAVVLTVVIPYLVIWGIALAGYIRLSTYANKIGRTKDGEAFQTISRGVLLLALWLPVSAVVSAQFSHIYQNHLSLTAALTILSNYINLAILVPAFIIVYKGSQKLLGVIKLHERISIRTVFLAVVFSSLYTWLVLSDSARRYPTHTAMTASYYQPDWLIILTIIIPRLVMWFFGIQAVHNIYRYMYKVKGAIYKDALRSLANGICGVVVASIILRCFQSLSSQVGKLSLVMVLLVVYALLLALAIGYVYMAIGAKRLKQIEEL